MQSYAEEINKLVLFNSEALCVLCASALNDLSALDFVLAISRASSLLQRPVRIAAKTP